ncbi:hypothetical protein CP532_1946 [Ophiocordyceps camponoti-leonardi (nom. inval.)]|nr:hypothetical protein CP532_1946 [Ophiocordyceps camponoti-leonardi (nom. inval.)]
MGTRKALDFFTSRVRDMDASQHAERRDDDPPGPVETYTEDEPTVGEWFGQLAPTWAGAGSYMVDLFPSASWIRRYNLRWLAGDLIAGITIGLVVVPQALAYASLAQLPPAYGLYTSFTGAALYWLFGTSKDIVIGATAVGSLLVGQVVSRVQEAAPDTYKPEETAHILSLVTGLILLSFGLLRLGWIVEFIPYIPISAFVTSASITIMSTQLPVALGIPKVDTRQPPYLVMISTLRGLNRVRLDAAIGLSAIVLLFVVKNFCSVMEKKQPRFKRAWAYVSSLRLTFTMLLFTLVSYLVHRNTKETKFRIVGHIDRGFVQAAIPVPKMGLLREILPELPAVAMILVIEHIAIAKSMGKLYGYSVDPSQETVALGAANFLSPFVGGYVCTGSFGASACLSKAGARSPLAGLFSAAVLVLVLYALTTVFYYIPNAALAGLIIHAVCNLVISPKKLYGYWQLSPPELIIWVVSVVLAIFTSLETSIYVGIGLSSALLLVRMARSKGDFLGRVRVRQVSATDGEQLDDGSRDVFLPLDRRDGTNPDIKMESSPHPGVFVYRLNEGFNYTNQAHHIERLSRHIVSMTRAGAEEERQQHLERDSDRLWNDPGPSSSSTSKMTTVRQQTLPRLRAVVLDLAAVNHVDVTSVQGLMDLRSCLDRHAAPDKVSWHLANVHNRWTRRALTAAGFGRPHGKAVTVSYYDAAETQAYSDDTPTPTRPDEETGWGSTTPVSEQSRLATVCAVDRPLFHLELRDAILSTTLSSLPARDLASARAVSRRFEACATRLLHRRLSQGWDSQAGSKLLLDCFHPSERVSTPYLSCSFRGTRTLETGESPSRGGITSVYSSFRPFVADDALRRRPWFFTSTGTGEDNVGGGGEEGGEEGVKEATQTIELEQGETLSQLCVATNLVRYSSVLVSHVRTCEGVVRLWRKWLAEMADEEEEEQDEEEEDHDDVYAEEEEDDDEEGYTSSGSSSSSSATDITSTGFLWVDAEKNVGLRFRVDPPPTSAPLRVSEGDDEEEEEEPPVRYTLVYQELLVRSCTLLIAMEAAEAGEDAAHDVMIAQFPSS